MKELDSFTVERLEEILNFDLPRHPAALEEIVALARIALAAKRAEPVAWFSNGAYYNTGRAALKDQAENPIPLYTTPQLNSPEIPESWPTEHMVIAGFESDAFDALSLAALRHQGWPYSCRESAECVTGIFKAMLAAAPEKENG